MVVRYADGEQRFVALARFLRPERRLGREHEARRHLPGLKPAIAAAAAGVSVRYANALLAQEDTSLEGYIMDA
jgi:hypothetical protein